MGEHVGTYTCCPIEREEKDKIVSFRQPNFVGLGILYTNILLSLYLPGQTYCGPYQNGSELIHLQRKPTRIGDLRYHPLKRDAVSYLRKN